ncbi:anti-sigma factor family protein [Streptomyces sp. TRM68416]|uniref:anti-sigma factor family protein n=1 Tax=Streptomyces sp. TRM68416 TaxID=2758412 RepID=UPI0016620FEF|nr:anti-sigma factor [Streptomyces sp. TRM68416]MBD0841048.1 hypothetical protein [Streptomyces sp. TRM68416]
MTSTTDAAGHPDVTEISDLTEGLLSPPRTTEVRRHLDECELCADVHASLEEIRGMLGTLPGPARMPDDVVGRIDAALAAEALLNATAPADADAPTLVGAPRAQSDADDSTRVSRETSLPADRPAGHARPSSTGPGRKDRTRRGRRRIAVLGTVFTVAALGFGSLLLSSLNEGGNSSPGADGRETAAAVDTFATGTLEKQVTDLLAQQREKLGGSRTPNSSLGVQSDPSSGGPRVYKKPAVPVCVQEGIGRNDAALATEEGTYKGTEALLVVLPDPADSSKVTAYLVQATCVADPSVDKAEVLLKRTYTRS